MTQLAETVQLDAHARELVEEHLYLVDHVTRRVTASFPRHVDREELARAGVLGLVEAAARFDPAKGRFCAYARRRIEGAILDEVRRRTWAPRSVRSQDRTLGQLEEDLTHQLGRRPSDEDLARTAGLTIQQLAQQRARSARGWVDTLDRPCPDGDRSVADLVTDRHARPTEERVEEDELRAYLRSAVVNLPERHRIVIVGYFLEGRSTEDLARLLGVSQSRVSQLKEYALQLMRWAIERQYQDRPPVAGRGRAEQARATYAALVAADAGGRAALGHRARPTRRWGRRPPVGRATA